MLAFECVAMERLHMIHRYSGKVFFSPNSHIAFPTHSNSVETDSAFAVAAIAVVVFFSSFLFLIAFLCVAYALNTFFYSTDMIFYRESQQNFFCFVILCMFI